MKQLICTLLLLASTILAATDDRPRFIVYRSGAAGAVTVQQPSSDAAKVYYEAGSVTCSTAATLDLEINGTAATSTAATPTPLVIGSGAVAKSTAYHTSNVGVGTVIGSWPLAADEKFSIDLSFIRTYGASATRNLTLRPSAGTCKVQIIFMEQQ